MMPDQLDSSAQVPPPLPPHPNTPDSTAPHNHYTLATDTGAAGASSNGTGPGLPDASAGSYIIPASRPPLEIPSTLPDSLTTKPAATLEELISTPPALQGLAEKTVFIPTAPPAPSPPHTSNTSPSITASSTPINSSISHTPEPQPTVTSLDVIIQQQLQAASTNKARADQLVQLIQTALSASREAASQALHRAQSVEHDWVTIEAEMYKALQPFTMEAFHSRMSRAVGEADQVSELLADSFLEHKPMPSVSSTERVGSSGSDDNEPSAPGSDDVNEFIKSYRKERKAYHMRREIVERWKEERVSRTY